MNIKTALETLRHFISGEQLLVIRHYCRGEEKEFFIAKAIELAQLVSTMPKVYEQDGKGDGAIVSLHYFVGSADWWITERDISDEQHQAFGLADLGYGAELGYISIQEIINCGAEIDLHFTPTTLGEVRAKAAA